MKTDRINSSDSIDAEVAAYPSDSDWMLSMLHYYVAGQRGLAIGSNGSNLSAVQHNNTVVCFGQKTVQHWRPNGNYTARKII
jgi:hypothetical protein